MNNPAHELNRFWPCFEMLVKDCDSVVEFGCAGGNNLLRVPAKVKIGIDIEPSYIMPRVGTSFYVGDALEYAEKFDDNSMDLVLLIDVVEHLEKPRAEKLLWEAQRIAAKRVILWIPEGYCPQDKDHYDYEEDIPYTPHQDHLSQWDRGELEALGFNVASWEGYHRNRDTGEFTVTALFCTWEKNGSYDGTQLLSRAGSKNARV